ncbi:MAG: homocysteine S-methyltransferase family protein, partial [Ruminococcus flavefaciens]|nr:homocysteine S-methyltransferase family protein [Ruminococcus flavefaciens]
MTFEDALNRRILVLDGALGTMLSGALVANACFDGLVVSRPELVREIHGAYIDAGADIITTCTLNANDVSLKACGSTLNARDINIAAARVARQACDMSARRIWIAGSVGPGNISLTQAEQEGNLSVYDDMLRAYYSQTVALIEGRVDIILVETVYNVLNCEVALKAVRCAMTDRHVTLPVIVSATLNGSGSLPSGHSIEALADLVTVKYHPAAIGLNCGEGVESLVSYIARLSHYPCAVVLYPNAGMSDESGRYSVSPDEFASSMEP